MQFAEALADRFVEEWDDAAGIFQKRSHITPIYTVVDAR